MSESREFRWENDSKSAQNMLFFIFFFFEKPQDLKKNEKRNSIFYYKNKNTFKFHAFTIKNDFGNASESGELRFENSLSFWKHQYLCLKVNVSLIS